MTAALQVALSTLSWIWSHKTLAALIAVALALAWSRHALSVATIEKDAAETRIAAYQHDARAAEDRAAETVATAKTYLDAYNQMKARAELLDADAKLQATRAGAQIADLARAKTAAETRAETLNTELERIANAPDATAAAVGRAALAGLH